MGHDAKQGRRALVDHVKLCLVQTNEMSAGVAEIRKAHNKHVEHVAAEVKKLSDRADGLNRWCKELEKAAAIEQRRLTATRCEVSQLTIEQSVFVGMTFVQRFRWFFTGYWPQPALPVAIEAPVDPSKPTVIAVREPLLAPSTPLTGYIPHTSLGPRVLP